MVTAVLAGLALGGAAARAESGGCGADVGAAETAAFAEADANGDGRLSPDEFASFTAVMKAKLDTLRFTRLDTDGDGVLSAAEIAAGRPVGPPPPL
jgi:hypothetical protein